MSEKLGAIEATGETRSLHFDRVFPYPPEKVWSALTEPDRLAQWFTTADVDAREGGSVSFDFGEHGVCSGRITAYEPPKVLEYEWVFPDGPRSVVRWELRGESGATQVSIAHTLMPPDSATGYAAGWHAYLDSLDAHLAGTTNDWQQRFEALHPLYTELAGTR